MSSEQSTPKFVSFIFTWSTNFQTYLHHFCNANYKFNRSEVCMCQWSVIRLFECHTISIHVGPVFKLLIKSLVFAELESWNHSKYVQQLDGLRIAMENTKLSIGACRAPVTFELLWVRQCIQLSKLNSKQIELEAMQQSHAIFSVQFHVRLVHLLIQKSLSGA